MFKKSRIIKSQDVSFISSISSSAGVRADFLSYRPEVRDHINERMKDEEKKFEKVLKESEQRIASVEQQAYEKGFSAGLEKGAELSRDDAQALVNALHDVIEGFESSRERAIKASEKQLLDLSFSIAELVIHQEISSDKGVVLSVLKAALGTIGEGERIKIRLNPLDFKYLNQIESALISGRNGGNRLFFEEDGTIPRGGAVLESDYGEVDARISEQLEEVRAAMANLQAS